MHLPDLHPGLLQGIGMTSQRTRNRMVERLAYQGIRDQRVLEVMTRAPRHLFLDEALSHRAYEDTSLPIGHGQTLSRPWIVARMSELVVQAEPTRVLEIGTGSGYQTLILSRLVEELWSVERINALHRRAGERLRLLEAGNVQLRLADGGHGWPEAVPFDVILLTACASEMPMPLLAQLADGGVMIAPVADKGGRQWLVRVRRNGNQFERERLEPVRFVPLLEGVIR
ncbi:protein-L-isoaspartate(D-aspartate) O-methyltransferase [Halomonas eurihalina]|uniref:Protein-L-isoaspartate O-methyltransferase n=1 Tax=Halomonas eurihalina TaxID=42566 RepID=A0A5D9CIT5_HALER|nr:protein-L-isoaspartate(D-aspartate) O-methyltransferase [Halomonas eurihalina]MDR5858835.1 protein-L-isoaspartate(D-aspartate) O-methyltransferase [Halomonas eurihalina]TZG31584.1 protein-L-isoaspartate(D-aspartate) O-methyltransferase [Halomonas eurihalina]